LSTPFVHDNLLLPHAITSGLFIFHFTVDIANLTVYDLYKSITVAFYSMKQIVLDTSAVILLSKCGLLEKACSSFELVAPASVIQETASKELAGKYPDAAFVRELVSRRLLRIEKPSSTKDGKTNNNKGA